MAEPMSDPLLADIRERATRELEAEEADFMRGARMRPLLPTPARRQYMLIDEIDRLRAELSESQRWFDALVTADKAQQGAADWYASVRWSDQAFGVIRTRGPHVLLEPVWNPLR